MKHLVKITATVLCLIIATACLFSCGKDKGKKDETNYAKIYTGNNAEDHFYFYYDLFDKSGNLIKHECTYMNEPEISMISDDVLKISVQAGTGIEALQTYYYNLSTNEFSPVYCYVLCEKDSTVAYYSEKKIIVTEIFNSESLIKEIVPEKELSDIAEPVVSASFSDDLSKIEITYLFGTESKKITETFSLKHS